MVESGNNCIELKNRSPEADHECVYQPGHSIVYLLLSALPVVGAEPRLLLKTHPTGLAQLRGENQAGLPKRRPFSRPHILIQFRHFPQDSELENLRKHGARVVGYVPETGVVVAGGDIPADSEEIAAAGALRPEDKWSPRLAGGAHGFVVEFHPDVDASDALAILREEGLEPRYHPDLLPNHAVVQAAAEQAARLVAWDEVAYVYPASGDLLNGVRLQACAGPLTAAGRIGQAVASVGEGWDGPGQGSARLGYYFGALGNRLPRPQVQHELLRALAEWGKYIDVGFTPAPLPNSARTITMLFAGGAHGDPYPFDGPGRTVAHTFYPAPPNPESIAGDMHFDAEEAWNIGEDLDVYTVALHEAGHALGLGHSDDPGSVMYPYYRRFAGLSDEDIAAARALYAAARAPGIPQPPGPKPPSDPSTPSIPTTPSTPGKPQEPPARPPAPPVADTVSPVLTVLYPASTSFLTYNESIVVRGTAGDDTGVVRVTWQDSAGAGGDAAGTVLWQTAPIPLRLGANTLTIRAFDAAGNMAWRSVSITRRNRAR